MKNTAPLFFGLILAAANLHAAAFRSPDILIDSKLNYDWSAVLVKKFRVLLKNNKLNDPFAGRFPAPIIVNEAQIDSYLSDNSRALLRDFGNAVGLNILKGETKVVMHGFAYDVKGFKTDLKASKVLGDGLVLGTEFSASELSLRADKISLTLQIPGRSNSTVFQIDLIKPVIKASQDKMINFFGEFKIEDNKDFYKLKIEKANFEKMSQGMIKNAEDIELNFERIVIPEVSIKVGNKIINFPAEKMEKLIQERHDAIKGILLAQVAETLRTNSTIAALKIIEQYKINKEYWIDTPVMKSQIQIGKFESSSAGDLQIDIPADFCTIATFNQHQKKCIDNKVTQISSSRINKALHTESVSIMKDLMDNGEANIVASISEDYLNKLLVTTYDAGLWKGALDEAGVSLGSNKVTMKLDERGTSGTLLMDVIYKPTTLEKIVTGSNLIRFPLVLDVSVRIEKHDNEPVIIVRLNNVDSSDETLINGRPKDNILSTVKDIPRFKTKVANTIRSRLASLKGKDVIELRYPELQDLGLDKVDFLSDGNGRMNAIMRLEDLLENN
jgi:hypothetical protein